MMSQKGRIGSSFDDFLKEEGIYEDVTAAAVKRLLIRQIEEAMQTGEVTKTEMARRMKTSRSQLDRLLDPENTKIQLDTLYRAARAIGRDIRLELV
jgi:predicted XRE-type DNA-binding protein